MADFLKTSWTWILSSGLLWYLLSGLLSFILAHKSQIDEWVESRPRLGGLYKILRGVGFDPWLVLQGLSLLVTGKLPRWSRPEPKEPQDASRLH